MDNTIKHGRVVFITQVLFAILPLLFVLFFEIDHYTTGEEKVTNIFLQCQLGIIAAAVLCVLWIIYKWFLFFNKLNYLNSKSEKLSQEEVIKLDGELAVNLNSFLNAAHFNFSLAALSYLSGVGMYQAILFSIPGLLVFVYSFKYSSMLLIKKKL